MSWSDGTYTQCTGYLEVALVPEKRRKTINRIIRHLRKISHTFDAIAITGVSGLLLGPTVADKLGKGIIVVRKDNDSYHAQYRVEGSILGRYIILDDLICSGETIDRMLETIKNLHNEFAQCVGIYLYRSAETEARNYFTTLDSRHIPVIINARKTKNANPDCFHRMAKWL